MSIAHINTPEDMEMFIRDKNVELIDATFVDPLGRWHSCMFHPSQVKAEDITKGLPFDGSSVKLFTTIASSDMLMKPDPKTCWIDPFRKYKVLHVTCSVCTSDGNNFGHCPRTIAQNAIKYMQKSGVAETALWGPEAEFFLFENAQFKCTPNEMHVLLNAGEAMWNSDASKDSFLNKSPNTNLAYRNGISQNYLQISPSDHYADIRSEMLLTLSEIGIPIEKHHHEVAAMQQELGYAAQDMLTSADFMMCYKYVIKNVAKKHQMTATFMPKPLFGTNGSGMHCHQSLWKNGLNIFHDEDGKYMKLSQFALWYIGGIIKHAPALLALTNPTINSYKRLVKGYEAPVSLCYSTGNRSAAIRIPAYVENNASAKRFEFRCPDAACCPYLAFAGLLMAGLDGIENKIDPGSPMDTNLYDLTPEELLKIKKTPYSLQSALDSLKNDNQFLLKGGVFSASFLQEYIELKEEEVNAMNLIPHPKEYELYYNC